MGEKEEEEGKGITAPRPVAPTDRRPLPPLPLSITRRRLLGTSASLAAASYIALLWLPPAAALALAWRRDAVCLPVDLDARGVTDAQRAACAAAGAASLAAWAVAFSSFLVFAALAARGRARARARHGLSGSAVEDCALWACCCPLVLAQEARTAAKADMERGGRG
jgi:Cys-rich protein (TIGR01571 family)